MTDVDREAKERMIHSIFEFCEASHAVDEHSRLRLERQAHVLFICVVTKTTAAVHQTVPQDRFVGLVHGCTGPETDGIGAQLLSDIGSPAKEFKPSFSIGRRWTYQRRLVLVPWIEQKSCS